MIGAGAAALAVVLLAAPAHRLPAAVSLGRSEEELRRAERADQARLDALFARASAIDGTSPRFRLPIACPRPTSRFGARREVPGLGVRVHTGVDCPAPEGTAVGAPAPGVVLWTGELAASGLTVVLGHAGGWISLHGHLSRIVAVAGERVEPGQILGEVGSTGRSTGPHLHWALWWDGRWRDPERA